MSYIKIITIIALNINLIITSHLDEYKPKLKRTNILNKGVWLKNKLKDTEQTNKLATFIFRPNSLDVDNLLQGNFNAFEDSDALNSPFLPTYMERSKRSYDVQNRKSLSNSENYKDKNIDDSSLVKSKMITKLKPASLFNDYPFEIAMLLGRNGIGFTKTNNSNYEESIKENNDSLIKPKETDKNSSKINIGTLIKETENFKDLYNITNTNISVYIPKRSRQSRYDEEVIKKVEFTEQINMTNKEIKPKVDRYVFDEKSELTWHQNAPVSNVLKYQVVPRVDETKKVKPMTERGLVKVLSMLTKTFKKIMRQHNDIKDVHRKIHNLNTDFLRNIVIITEKFKDFDEKYSALNNFNKRIKSLEERFKTKERHMKTKENELAQNLLDFESQQKKFLNQQRQFYNIQKLMLAQNEKINTKQNMIARTQSEISHRQNNFARILKKAKQIYIDKHPVASKITSIFAKIKNNSEIRSEDVETTSTTVSPVTDSIKINLFSIPSERRLENQDELLLNEKDDQPIDDLVYKYYFNNTFIDNLMKTNFLSSFVPIPEQIETRNFKNKRNKATELETTVLLPVNKSPIELNGEENSHNRERRWISHHSHKKSRRHHKQITTDNLINDEKTNKKPSSLIKESMQPNESIKKSEPFLIMAKSFCNGIGQNSTKQVLDWCIEKALRRLQNIGDMKMPPARPKPEPGNVDQARAKDAATTPGSITIVPTAYISTSTANAGNAYDSFFPNNDQLESNLEQYAGEAPDMEGNVYYDGSLHASDIIPGPNSGGSDILPGLDSNSKIDDIDPMTLDTQAMRRAFITRLKYENMLKTMSRITP